HSLWGPRACARARIEDERWVIDSSSLPDPREDPGGMSLKIDAHSSAASAGPAFGGGPASAAADMSRAERYEHLLKRSLTAARNIEDVQRAKPRRDGHEEIAGEQRPR